MPAARHARRSWTFLQCSTLVFHQILHLTAGSKLRSTVQASLGSSRLAAAQELLHRAGTSHLLQSHAVCEGHFDRCWKPSTASWMATEQCTGVAPDCVDLLCSTWLEANCMEGGYKCSRVSSMCRASAGFSLLQGSAVRHVASGNVSNATGDDFPIQGHVEEKLVFLHIPKNAGTAIENAGKLSNVRWGRHRMFYFGMMPMPDKFYCATHHIPPGRLPHALQEIYRRNEVFCVTRHPYDRAISEYKYLLSVPWGQNKPGVLDREPCTADGLNYFLQTSLKMVLEGKRYVNDCHMLPQSEFIWDQQRQWCQDIMRFDNMPKVFNTLMKTRNYKVSLDHTENQSAGTCPDLSEEDLSNTTRAMLDKVYAQDFTLLGYKKGQGAVVKVPLRWQQ